jgi:filamin
LSICIASSTHFDKTIHLDTGSGDIVTGNLKLILGLIWTLILHYQIKLGLGLGDSKGGNDKNFSAKAALLKWVQDKIPHKNVTDFTSSWNDGTSVAALVDAIAPGLCPEADTMNPKNALSNAQYAMTLAEDWLDVPMVLTPDDMVNPYVDELSMMTYLSQYPDAQLKPGAPIKARRDPNKVIVSGPGIEGDNLKTGQLAVFYVDVKEAGNGKLGTIAEGPDGPVEIHMLDNGDLSYNCSYVPMKEGPHTISINWDDKPVRESPYTVNVLPGTNAMACRAYGPGVDGTDLKEAMLAEFSVETIGAGEGELSVSVRGPKGPLDNVSIQQDSSKDDLFHIEYTPPTPSQYIVEVKFAGLHIKDSPFKVRVIADKPDASKCYAEGPGVSSTELEVNQETWFVVHTQGAGRGELVANTRGPHGEVPMISTPATEYGPGAVKYSYTPKESGELVITIKYGGDQIPGSRFRVEVHPPPRPDKCIASGPGLAPRGIRVNEPTHFNVKTKEAGRGTVDVSIVHNEKLVEYTIESSLHAHDYTYQVDTPGLYIINVKFADVHVTGSPFPVAITDASLVKITGYGAKGEPVLVGVPLSFMADTRGAGPGDITCHVIESSDGILPDVTQLEEDQFEIRYTPNKAGLQKMNVTFDEAAVPNTPLRLVVYDPSQVSVKGPGLEPGNKSEDVTHFIVDTRFAGEGHLKCAVDGPVDTRLTTKDQANGFMRCEYIPKVEGNYIISITLEDHHIPGSPFDVFVSKKADPSLVTASGYGLDGSRLTTNSLAEFFVDYSEAGDGEVQVKIEGPAGGVEFHEEIEDAGITKYSYFTDPDEAGLYVVDITFADEPIPGSPYHVPVAWKPDPSRVLAEGNGLEGGTSKEWAEFTVNIQKAGDGVLKVNIEGPCSPQALPTEDDNELQIFKYFPELPGNYKISITFNDEHIPGSPFQPIFELGTDPSQCKAKGPGLRENGVKVGDPGDFIIDTTEAGPGTVDVVIEGQSSILPVKPTITSNGDATYSVQYNPRKVGTYIINVVFADTPIPGSPFTVNVTDPNKIILTGPGCQKDEKSADVLVGSDLQWMADVSQAGPGTLIGGMAMNGMVDDITITPNDNLYQLDYKSTIPGPAQLVLKYSGNLVDISPSIAVFDPTKINVYGPAFEGINIGDESVFYIDCSEAGEANLNIEIAGPSPTQLDASNESTDSGVASFNLSPDASGVYKLSVKFGNRPVPNSPFDIPVRDITKVIARGSGITGEGARVGELADVIIDTVESGPAVVGVAMTSPSGEKEEISLMQNEEDQLLYGGYTPKEPGYYGLEVTYNNEMIPDSPYQVPIGAPESVVIDGNSTLFAFVGEQNIITSHTDNAGPGEITAKFTGLSEVSSYTEAVDDNCQLVYYSPDKPGTYEAHVLYNQFPVEDKPRIIMAVDLSKVMPSGPGLESGVLAHKPTYFNVDVTNAGQGNLKVSMKTLENMQVPVEISKLDETTYRVDYTSEFAGPNCISILYNDKEIAESPIYVEIVDPDKVKCSGNGLKHAIVNEPTQFILDYTKAGKGSANIDIEGTVSLNQNDDANGIQTVTYVIPKAGPFDINVQFNGIPVPGSPFKAVAQRPPPDATKCIVSGLENIGSFLVDCKDAGGTGMLEVGVCGAYLPVEFVSVKHNGDYTFSVSYDIGSPGKTTISVKWHDQHLAGSPFTVS